MVNLSPRARAIHDASTIVVMHDHRPVAEDAPRMIVGGVTAKVYMVGVDVDIGPDFMASAAIRDGWSVRARAEIETTLAVISADPHLVSANSAANIRRAKADGKAAIVLGVEGGKLLEGHLSWVKEFYDTGLRQFQLCWAVPNQLVETDHLTDFGKTVVKECDRLGLIVDLTHFRERAFYEVMEIVERPPIVSHGAGGTDGLDDRRIEAIAAKGGMIGIHFYSSYLGPSPTVNHVVQAIQYLTARVDIRHVGFGIDFFPTKGPWRDFQHGQGTTDVSWAIPDLSHMPLVTQSLVENGYTDTQISGLLGGHFLDLMERVAG
ncbi:MAG: membrane dipeptidase [candidate division Zixibacteria bacterium]|nr:membrane dipeptidase [candidate division Zixibacteria bacterium]